MTDRASEREAALERRRQRARDAYERARDEEAAGRNAEASLWYERAHRLARADQTIAFSLAMARLRLGDAHGAIALLLPVAAATDGREVWMSLAIARHLQGLAPEAARMLGEALRSTVDTSDWAVLQIATAIAAAGGAAGWCGVEAGGRVLVRTNERGLEIAVSVDGVHCLGGIRSADSLSSDIDLPDGWRNAARIDVHARGRGGARRLVGTPIDLRAMLRIDGSVESDGHGGLSGWAWHPNAPEIEASLTVRTLAGRRLVEAELTQSLAVPGAMQAKARARAFAVSRSALPAGVVRIVDERGRDLLGSPLDPDIERRATAALVALAAGGTGRATVAAAARFAPVPAEWTGEPPAALPYRRRRAIAIVVPVHRGLQRTLDCLDSIERTVPRGTRTVVIDDASPEPALIEALDARAAEGRIVLHRHPGGHNRGFPASANLGFVAAEGRDVVLLNSDTVVAGDWLARLRAAVYAAADIGSATPFTNEGSIAGYPKPSHPNEMPDAHATEALHALAARANDGLTAELPTGNGFCMFIRRDCLDAVGLLREDLFAQGYGEENDWCLRARHQGWRHVAALDTYVAHAGGTSFRAGRAELTRRNGALLNRLHPGYDALIARHIAADPLGPARRRFDLARLDALLAGAAPRDAVLLVTHQAGGGVERFVRTRMRAIEQTGLRPIVLRGDDRGDRTDLCLVEPALPAALPNLRFELPAEAEALAALLRALVPRRVEIHHTLGHHPTIVELCRGLGVPVEVWQHDFAWFCPRVSLLGPDGRYCGEPPVEDCRRCIAEAGSRLGDGRSVDEVIAQSTSLFAQADRIVSPSADAAARLRAHFPGLQPVIEPPEPAFEPAAAAPPPPPEPGQPFTVCVVGAIGPEKGVETLIGCVRDAAARALPLRFVVVGHTSEDERLLAAGPAFVTGPYDEDESAELISRQRADIAFLPSIWPETWCYALSECWRAGLPAVAFDIGAPAERIGAAGRGWLLPLDTPEPRINDALLAFLQQRNASEPSRSFRGTQPPATAAEGLVRPPQSARSMRRSPAGTGRLRDAAS